jgi:hypothetical protein
LEGFYGCQLPGYLDTAPCGRGSEAALAMINDLPSRDHRERRLFLE